MYVSKGQRFNAEGNIEKWWTDESQMAFDSLKKCYIDQYSGYTQGGLLVHIYTCIHIYLM